MHIVHSYKYTCYTAPVYKESISKRICPCKYEKYYGHQNKLGFTQADAKMRAFVKVTCKREIIWKVGKKGAGRRGSGMGEGRALGNSVQLKSLSWTSGAWMCDYISRNSIKVVIDCGLTPHC